MEKDFYGSDLEKEWPKNLDLNHSELASLSSAAAVEIDFHLIKNEADSNPAGKEPDLRPVRRLGKIIYLAFSGEQSQYSFNDFYLRKIFSRVTDSLLDAEPENYRNLGLELIKLRTLPFERQKELRGLCVSLSREFSSHWADKHPNGFKRYVA